MLDTKYLYLLVCFGKMMNTRNFFFSQHVLLRFSLNIIILSPDNHFHRVMSSVIALLPIKTSLRYLFVRPLVRRKIMGNENFVRTIRGKS